MSMSDDFVSGMGLKAQGSTAVLGWPRIPGMLESRVSSEVRGPVGSGLTYDFAPHDRIQFADRYKFFAEIALQIRRRSEGDNLA